MNMSWHVAIKQSKLKPGKKKMLRVAKKLVMIGQSEDGYFATEALCRHMRWPLAYGSKIIDGCVRCPLHQTRHKLEDGELVEWSPFPLFPAYGKLVGKFSRKKNLRIYETRVNAGNVEIKIES